MFARNEANPKNTKWTADLMNEKEFNIDDSNITLENILNIVTGRIPTFRLRKALNHLDYTEYSEEESANFNMNESALSQVSLVWVI